MQAVPSPDPDPHALAVALRSASIELRPPVRPELLTGGYSWRTYLLTGADGASVVLRLAPRGGTLEPYDPQIEARAIAASRGAVPAPRVLAVQRGPEPLGDPYLIQSTAPGRVLRLSAVSDAGERELYRTSFARALGTLHRRGDPTALGTARTVTEALRDELELVAQRYRRAAAWPRVGFEIGLRWLLTHLPATDERPVFCHGDYRFGNLSWTAPGELGAVLDWERAWCGDPMADVAFTRVYSGWCAVDGAAVAEYERAGPGLDPSRLRYAARFERVRSYTASMLGAEAFRSGRSNDGRLLGIGASGESGMASLIDWLGEGPLVPLPSGWRVEVDEAELPAYPRAALEESVEVLRRCALPEAVAGDLGSALGARDPGQAWRGAFTILAPFGAGGTADAVAALSALCMPAHVAHQTID